MKTDDLIDVLSRNVEPTREGRLGYALFIGLVVGAIGAICLMLALFGVPTEVLRREDVAFKGVAFAFTLALAAAGASFLIKSARPGKPKGMPLVPIVLLFAALLAASCFTLAFADRAAWSSMVFGPHWATCLFCIPLLAAAPFASLIWALREGAPTHLGRTGAIAGLDAGALGAAVFAFLHPGESIPFIMFWYGGPILICAAIGAVLGPRLLRW